MRLGTYYRLEIMPHLGIPQKVDKALDIGCHDGAALAQLSASEKWGIDVELPQVRPGPNYVEGDFLTHDFGDMHFDLITAFDVIEHIEDHGKFLAKVERLLAPGGVAVLTTPSERMRVFPGLLQGWVDKKWGHIYRRGYSHSLFRNLTSHHAPSLKTEVDEWSAPAFRTFYLPLSTLWRISPAAGRSAARAAAAYDAKRTRGEKGYLLVHLRKPADEQALTSGG